LIALRSKQLIPAVIAGIYLGYLLFAIAMTFVPWGILADLDWWKRASIASII